MRPLAAPGALWVLSRAGKVPRPPAGGRNLSQGTDFLWKAGESPALLFCYTKGFASAEATKGLSGRPLETFGVPPLERDGGYKKWIFCGRQGKAPPCFFCFAKGFASAEATKGLSGRPLETFGVPPLEMGGGSTKNGLLWKARKMPALLSLYYIGFRSSKEIMTRL